MKNGEMEENLVRKYTYQILKGCEYLHGNNVIHRDIKGTFLNMLNSVQLFFKFDSVLNDICCMHVSRVENIFFYGQDLE